VGDVVDGKQHDHLSTSDQPNSRSNRPQHPPLTHTHTPPPPQLAKESVEEVLSRWSGLLSNLDDKKKGEMMRSMGLRPLLCSTSTHHLNPPPQHCHPTGAVEG